MVRERRVGRSVAQVSRCGCWVSGGSDVGSRASSGNRWRRPRCRSRLCARRRCSGLHFGECLHRPRSGGHGPLLENSEIHGPLTVQNQKLTIQYQARWELNRSRSQVGKPVLDQRTPPGLEQEGTARSARAEGNRPVPVPLEVHGQPTAQRPGVRDGLADLGKHGLHRRAEAIRAHPSGLPLQPGMNHPKGRASRAGRNIARDRRLAKPAILGTIGSPPPRPARTSKGTTPRPQSSH